MSVCLSLRQCVSWFVDLLEIRSSKEWTMRQPSGARVILVERMDWVSQRHKLTEQRKEGMSKEKGVACHKS
jgi:hypothetical protein